MGFLHIKAQHIGQGSIHIGYLGAENNSQTIKINCLQAYVTPTLNSSTLTYNGTTQELVTGTDTSNVTSYSLGYKKSTQASDTSQITWVDNPTGGKLTTVDSDGEPKVTDAGIYNIYYRYEADDDYCGNSVPYVHVGSVTINKATVAPEITVNSGELTYNENSIYFVTSSSKPNGLTSYYLGYRKGGAPIVWVDGDDLTDGKLTTVDSDGEPKVTDAGIYFIFCKYTGDGNHTSKAQYSVGTVTVKPLIPTITITLNNSTPLTYNGNVQELVSGVTIDNLLTYKLQPFYLGYTADKVATSDSDVTWVENPSEGKLAGPNPTDATTYYIYYKYEADANHGGNRNNINDEDIGIVNINESEISIVTKPIPSLHYNKNEQNIELSDYITIINDVDPTEFYDKIKFKDIEIKRAVGGGSTDFWERYESGKITIPGHVKGYFKIGADIYIEGFDVNYKENYRFENGARFTWGVTVEEQPPININYIEDSIPSGFTYPEYVRLDDDVSFQIVRTNPKLTTNTKLMYDGENLYMEAYPAADILSTITYKNKKIYSTGLFNKDLRKFLIGTDRTAYVAGQDVDDTVVLNDFDNQFENMYWCGVESINSDVYPQEMGCVAPLYLRKKRPNYFVIFKIDTPANTNLVEQQDLYYDFESDILKKARIVKSFDLREGTPIGNYIRRYVEQKNFEYDRSIYVNFSSNEIYYYGIDKTSGVLTQKIENFEEPLLHNDNTIMRMDDWITSGFERNNLIFPYIINFEFLFDDKETEEYKFARYFGMYCNDIDLWEYEIGDVVNNENKTTSITVKGDDIPLMSEESFYYIKDKKNNIYSIKDKDAGDSGDFKSPSKLNKKDFTGFELTSVSEYAERVSGPGRAIIVFEITSKPERSETVGWQRNKFNIVNTTGTIIKTFRGTGNTQAGGFTTSAFSCLGEIEDVAKALAGAINSYDEGEFKWIHSYSVGNKVIMESRVSGTEMNGLFDINGGNHFSAHMRKITPSFDGGTDLDGTVFKIRTEDVGVFLSEEDHPRCLKCIGGLGAEIRLVIPYVHDGMIDDEYSLLITDNNGPKVSVSNIDVVEIVDKFYSKAGVLSFFPVKDFDFDTSSSVYGNDEMIQEELASENNQIKVILDNGDSDSDSDVGDSDSDEKFITLHINHIPYGRFFYHNGNTIDTEYEYFLENIIPELCTVNKTVPYIAKWGYIDDSKDSCENPYRLNTSKIFEACNFSANTFSRSGDILEYTHSMPYYVNNIYDYYYTIDNMNNEYQYIPVSKDMWNLCKEEGNYDDIVDVWVTYFSNTETNNFEKMFGDTSSSQLQVVCPAGFDYDIDEGGESDEGDEKTIDTIFSNKRFNKKYSRFLLGNRVIRSSTLFRGVKFEIEELKEDKEVYTGKYNDYKFSFIYVPVCNVDDCKNIVHFIKNDKYKFIVGFVLFDVNNPLKDRGFNKAYVYAGSMYYIQ